MVVVPSKRILKLLRPDLFDIDAQIAKVEQEIGDMDAARPKFEMTFGDRKRAFPLGRTERKIYSAALEEFWRRPEVREWRARQEYLNRTLQVARLLKAQEQSKDRRRSHKGRRDPRRPERDASELGMIGVFVWSDETDHAWTEQNCGPGKRFGFSAKRARELISAKLGPVRSRRKTWRDLARQTFNKPAG